MSACICEQVYIRGRLHVQVHGCARLYTLVQHTEVVGRISLAREHERASHPGLAAGVPRRSVSLTASLLCTGRALMAPAHPPTHSPHTPEVNCKSPPSLSSTPTPPRLHRRNNTRHEVSTLTHTPRQKLPCSGEISASSSTAKHSSLPPLQLHQPRGSGGLLLRTCSRFSAHLFDRKDPGTGRGDTTHPAEQPGRWRQANALRAYGARL